MNRQYMMYKKAIDSSRDLIAAVDENYRYLFANREYLGYHRIADEADVVGAHVSEVLGREAFSLKVKPHLDAALRGEEISFDMEREYPWAEVKKEMNVSYYPLRDEDSIIGVVAIIRDVTERKRYERRLEEDVKRKRLLREAASGFLSEHDQESAIEKAVRNLHFQFPEFRVAYSKIRPEGRLVVEYAVQPEGMPDITSMEANLTIAPEYLDSLRRHKRTVVKDVTTDKRLEPLEEAMKAGGTRGLVDIAVIREGEAIGLLCFDSPRPKRWSEHEIETLDEHADLFALILSNERHRWQNEEINAILQGAMSQSQAGIAVADAPDGRIRYINEAGLDLCCGGVESYAENAGMDEYTERWKLFHIDGTPFRSEDLPLSRAVRCGETSSETFIIGDGSIEEQKVIWANAAPVNNSSGKRIAGVVVFLDITETKRQEKRLISEQEKLQKALAERETLIKEVHHRVKNNLNVVISLLKLQYDELVSVEDARTALSESCNRIYSMALVHESLYLSENLSKVEMGRYVETLTGQLRYSMGQDGGVEYSLDLDPVSLDITKAIPCGIILNELITNAQQHAFPDRAGEEKGADRGEFETGEKEEYTISVRLKRLGEGKISLIVEDNGTGLPDDFSPDDPKSLGFTLIHTLTSQIDASLEYLSGKSGTTFEITIPII